MVEGTPVASLKGTGCHGKFHKTDSAPVHQIHKGAIHLNDSEKIEVQPIGSHQIDVTCQSCGCRLVVYASKKGAFCQLGLPIWTAVCGSLPSDSFLMNGSYGNHIPKSMRRLFQEDQIKEFISEKATHYLADDDHFLPPQNSGVIDQDAEDYDMMFANADDPIVGSYSELGQFTKEGDYLIFAD